MKKTLTLVSVALVALIMSSCVESSEKYQTLLAEKEAIAAEKATMESQYNAAFGIINDVENNLQAIRDAENMLLVKQEGSQREQIVSELIQIKEAMATNRARLDSLGSVLDKANKNNGYLRGQIKKLQDQLKEKETMIADLQAQVAEKDGQIAGLNNQVENLNADLNNANAEIEKITNENNARINEMNAVYYIGATKKELKEKGILTSKYSLRTNVPTQEFTKADKRDLNEIVFNAKKVKLLSTHVEGSYTIVRNGETVTLQITNPEAFWSVTKYLVAIAK